MHVSKLFHSRSLSDPVINVGAIIMLHIAVAVIIKKNRFLISKRADHVHLGGLWEFPGGKVEAGESIQQGLYREIKEELGISIEKTQSLIKISYDYKEHYSEQSLLLNVYKVTQFKTYERANTINSQQKGLEGQPIKWVTLAELDDYQFPAANKAIINALKLPAEYLITPDIFSSYEHPLLQEFLDDFARNCKHYSLIQLRIPSLVQKVMQPNERHQFLYQICRIAQQKKVSLLVNSAMPVEERIRYLSSGIHLTSSDLYNTDMIKHYRRQFTDKLIAASCHCPEDIHQANQLALDFIVLSPVQQTSSHPEQTPMGWEQFADLADIAQIPIFALGGMTINDIERAQQKGAQGVAAISSLWNQDR